VEGNWRSINFTFFLATTSGAASIGGSEVYPEAWVRSPTFDLLGTPFPLVLPPNSLVGSYQNFTGHGFEVKAEPWVFDNEYLVTGNGTVDLSLVSRPDVSLSYAAPDRLMAHGPAISRIVFGC